MNRPRPSSARLALLVAVSLGAAALSLPGCQPQSEGRPAGSIEVKNAQAPDAATEAAKARTSPRKR